MRFPASISLSRAACVGAACLLLALHAVAAPPADPVDDQLDALHDRLVAAQKELGAEQGDAALNRLRGEGLAVQADAGKAADAIAPALANVEARITQLGPAPAAPATEAPDIAAQRADLEKTRKALDAQVKLARLLVVEAGQAAEQGAQLRRAQFNARLGERTASIFSPEFWNDLAESRMHDEEGIARISRAVGESAGQTPVGAWLALIAACAAAIAFRVWAARKLPAAMAARVPPGRLRRSLLAFLSTLLAAAVPAFVAQAIRLGLTWRATLPESADALLGEMVAMVAFGAVVAGLGKALLSAGRPSWRLPPIDDAGAVDMRRYPLALGIVIAVGALAERVASLVNAGLATAVAINAVFAIVLGSVLARALHAGERLRRVRSAAKEEPGAHAAPWLSIATLLAWMLLVASLIGVLVGYVALGAFVVKQVAWTGVVLASAYLLNSLLDDALTTWLGPPASDNDRDDRIPTAREQAGVLISAFARLAVVLFALVLIAAPYGQGPLELLQRAGSLRDGLSIGEFKLQPGAVLQSLLVLTLGILAVRLAQHWLSARYLPTTALDKAMRESATTLLGYTGIVVAIAFALSALGIGLERIAWVASALSVGIGFGLQAVVSNFVSGLILLAERPVKVGDWVALSGVEGDIRRINVRATEIEMGDRSTVIVPNSEFITKIVRNVTHANPLGLVQIKLPMPLDTDTEKVRDLMLAAFAEQPAVLANPEPNVFLDAIDGNRLVFNASGFASSPRAAYGVKSALLFDILKRLRAAGLPIAKPQTMLLREAETGGGDTPSAPPGVSAKDAASL